MNAPRPEPNQRDAVRRSVVARVLGSMAFRRSREASAQIVDDPESLRDLTESVRDRGFDSGPLEPVADRIDAALHLLEDRAEQLEAEQSQETPEETLPPAKAARHRLIVAAMHYLARKRSAQDADAPEKGTELDDVVVVREVLSTAEGDLAPYLGPDESAGSSGRFGDNPQTGPERLAGA